MRVRELAGIFAATVLLAASSSTAADAGRVEPLDGTQSITHSAIEPAIHPESSSRRESPLTVPQTDFSPRTTTPFGAPSPPNQLTPAPTLPFNPNRSLIPPSSPSHSPNPAPYSGSGRFGR